MTETSERPHELPAEQVLQGLGTDRQRGLSAAAAAGRLREHGPNRLSESSRRPLWRMLVDQFGDFLILILVAAAILNGIVGELGDTIAILAILVLNAVLGLVQEVRAQRAILALKRLAAPHATVIRDGETITIEGEELVPGDLCVLEAGAAVPADLRLVEAHGLQHEEAALTGESVPVEKDPAPVTGNVPVGDRTSMAWMGTFVTRGRGLGVVTATGMQTEMGKIAALIHGTGVARTPLQKRLDSFGRRLGLMALGVCALIFALGLLRGEPWIELLLAAVSLAVAAVPEALPAVVTICLALGARRMAKQQALVRRLPAVETLGSVTVICSDKTGTLTLNKMTAEEVQPAADDEDVTRRLYTAAVLCNDAEFTEGSEAKGDPTEVALLAASSQHGLERHALEGERPRTGEIPFDGARKRMTTLHGDGPVLALMKGAPEALLPCCTAVAVAQGSETLDDAGRTAFLQQAEAMAANGLRTLAFAERELPSLPQPLDPEQVEREATFLGLIGLLDPPRADAAEAVAQCRQAGIRPVLITGDHPVTARAIAARLDVFREGEGVLAGPDLEAMDDEALRAQAGTTSIYARVSPEHKVRIVRALQQRGEITAMTGDGVNDAPALRQADIGVAMGRSGTDVARETSQLVLLDDRYATIVAAIAEGRRIYDNIRRFVRYVLATNSMEIWVMLLTPFFFPALGLPLLPIQILWINLVTDGPPAIALALEPAEPDVMTRPPRPPGESLFARGVGIHILWVGLFITALALLAVWLHGEEHSRTVIFLLVTFAQMAHVVAIRSEVESVWRRGLRSNPWLLGAIVLTVALSLLVVYVPALQPVFHTEALPLPDLALCIGLSLLVIVAVEIEKAIWRRRTPTAEPQATSRAG